MKKTFLLITIIVAFTCCKNEAVKRPNPLIAREVMVNIMYDLTILDAIKYQNLNNLETHKIKPNEYIFKKYKIDSLQFARNNAYYASDFKTYKDIYDSVSKRLDKSKTVIEKIVKAEKKKADLLEKVKQKAKAKVAKDSLKKVKDSLKTPSEYTRNKFHKL